MAQLAEYIVTLHNRQDLESFYEDMETPGGDLYIPNRSVELSARRPISRNTHYMLTHEEAEELKKDPRVWDVISKSLFDDFEIRPSYQIENGEFDKTSTASQDNINWGLLRHTEENNRTNWGSDGSQTSITDDVTITASGKNVDVLIMDGHIDPSHPEFAVNADGTGGSRVIQYNWLQNDVGFGTGTYVYTPYIDPTYPDNNGDLISDRTGDNNHGCHVASTVAGNTLGWARDANIYNLSIYASNQNFGQAGLDSSTMWDYVRAWHNSKPVNSATGRRNPTISNNSYGVTLTFNSGRFGPVEEVSYRGTVFAPGRALTVQEMQDRGFYTNDDTPNVPGYSTAREADIQDAIDDGIIMVFAAGNDSWKITNSTDQDYNNAITAGYELDPVNSPGVFTPLVFALHRGSLSGQSYTPNIIVGNLGSLEKESKIESSNCGNQVDIFAAGTNIIGALHTPNPYFSHVQDPRNSSFYLSKYTGTSMASPQVAGILACLLEHWPGMTQAEAQEWVTNNAPTSKMFDTGADDPMDRESLQGAPNKLALWINQRPITGTVFPRKNIKSRPASGSTYPRARIRRRG